MPCRKRQRRTVTGGHGSSRRQIIRVPVEPPLKCPAETTSGSPQARGEIQRAPGKPILSLDRMAITPDYGGDFRPRASGTHAKIHRGSPEKSGFTCAKLQAPGGSPRMALHPPHPPAFPTPLPVSGPVPPLSNSFPRFPTPCSANCLAGFPMTSEST